MRIPMIVLAVFTAAACGRSEPAAPPPAAGLPDCATLTGDNAVQAEMRMLECAMQRAVAAIARDDLAAIPAAIHVVHGAKQRTHQALESGAYKPAGGDLAAFVAMDETFHRTLETLVEAANARDHAATATALGASLAQCQGCHATFRPSTAKPPAAPPEAHAH
jgi:hypothetical protein